MFLEWNASASSLSPSVLGALRVLKLPVECTFFPWFATYRFKLEVALIGVFS